MLAVAYAQDSMIVGENVWINGGTAAIVDAARAARNDQALAPGKVGGRCFTGPHFGVDTEIAHFAGDEVAVLPTRVQNCDLWNFDLSRWRVYVHGPLFCHALSRLRRHTLGDDFSRIVE